MFVETYVSLTKHVARVLIQEGKGGGVCRAERERERDSPFN